MNYFVDHQKKRIHLKRFVGDRCGFMDTPTQKREFIDKKSYIEQLEEQNSYINCPYCQSIQKMNEQLCFTCFEIRHRRNEKELTYQKKLSLAFLLFFWALKWNSLDAYIFLINIERMKKKIQRLINTADRNRRSDNRSQFPL